jgi:hypothetical protein
MRIEHKLSSLLVIAALCVVPACIDEHDSVPDAPGSFLAVPRNGEVTVSWSSSGNAKTFNVYYGLTPDVTTSEPKVTVTGSPAVVPSLANGTPYYFAVSGVNDAGEGPLSSVACAVPTPADTTGLTLYDPLCGAVLDGSRWGRPGAYSMGVASGAAELSVDVSNQAPRAERGIHYTLGASVRTAPGQRVTTLRADVRVSSATASRSGDAQIRGTLRMQYQPPAVRYEWPDSLEHLVLFEVGLVDTGAGLKAFRSVVHCDAIRCPVQTSTGIEFTDPAGFSAIDPTMSGAPAAYDTPYTVTASLDESTGIFHWTIAGGTFGAGISGSADPSAYLAGTSAWSGVPLGGAGFWSAQIAARTFDTSPAGGGSGRVTVRFDDVHVGLDGAAPAPFDDFGGMDGNSGPTELSVAKWIGTGSDSVRPSGGRLAIQSRVTSTGFQTGVADRLNFARPESINAIQADVAIPSFTPGAGAHVGVQGTFYNDGSAGSTASSPLGDILAGVFLYRGSETAQYVVGRCANATCGALDMIVLGTFEGVAVGAERHTVLVKWNPAIRRFTFGVDGNTVTVDPTSLAPVTGPPNAPLKRIFTYASVPPVAGATASAGATVNNVFVAQ